MRAEKPSKRREKTLPYKGDHTSSEDGTKEWSKGVR